MIEAAVCIFALLIILYGVAELGFLYRTAAVASSATRAGARLAAATYVDAPNKLTAADNVRLSVEEALRERSNTDVPTIMRIYQADANGNPVSGTLTSCTSNCLLFSWIGNRFVYQSGTWASPDGCGTVIDRIGVYVQLTHSSFTDLVNIDRNVNERTIMRLEPSPACTTG